MNTKDRRAIVTNILRGDSPRDSRGRIDWQKLFAQDPILAARLGADTLKGRNRLNCAATAIRRQLKARKKPNGPRKWTAGQRAKFKRTRAARYKASKPGIIEQSQGVGFPALKPEHVNTTPAIRMRFCPQCGCDLGAYLAASTLF